MERDEERAVAALVAAFHDDPVCGWLFPDAATRSTASAHLFTPFVAAAAKAGTLDVADDGAGAAVWLPTAAGESFAAGGDAGELPEALVPHLPRLVAFGDTVASRHPAGRDHLYLPFLGVRPGRTGRGVGGHLLAARLARADAEGVPAYLEASSPRNIPLYERHGFRSTGDPITLPDGPTVWPMWREPNGEAK